jgi:predicted MFS family arabinose efflux permease
MTEPTNSAVREEASGNRRLAILLAMAMFVLVVDTSLMNVSIASVVRDLDTTVSGVQSAIALEALVSAAFILIGSKVGDLIGRKRAYVLGLLGYAVGALAMTLAQGLTAIIVFWALVGGIGASLLLPSMQSLIHGNFEGTAQKQAYALVGAAGGGGVDRRRGRPAARRVHHHLPVVAHRVPARGRHHRGRAVRHRAGPRRALHRVAGR